MLDTPNCPICGQKLTSINRKNHQVAGKISNWVEKTCNGMNHLVKFWKDIKTNSVEFLHLSLNPSNSRYIDIDFINQQCRIHCMKSGKPNFIMVNKLMHPDFPKLEKIKRKVEMIIVFS